MAILNCVSWHSTTATDPFGRVDVCVVYVLVVRSMPLCTRYTWLFAIATLDDRCWCPTTIHLPDTANTVAPHRMSLRPNIFFPGISGSDDAMCQRVKIQKCTDNIQAERMSGKDFFPPGFHWGDSFNSRRLLSQMPLYVPRLYSME